MSFRPSMECMERRDTPSGFTAVAPLAVTAQVTTTYRPPPTPWVPQQTQSSIATQSLLGPTSYLAATTYYTSALVAYPIDQLS